MPITLVKVMRMQRHVTHGWVRSRSMSGSRRLAAVSACASEGRRLLHPAADDVAGQDDQGAEQERDPPAPGLERLVGQERGEGQQRGGGQDRAGLGALQAEAREEAAPAVRGVLHDHGAGAAELAGHGEALDHAEDDQQDRREDADLGVGGQQADQEGREAHQEHREDQDVLAAVPVTPGAQNDGADGSGEVADRVGCQRGDQRDGRVLRRGRRPSGTPGPRTGSTARSRSTRVRCRSSRSARPSSGRAARCWLQGLRGYPRG